MIESEIYVTYYTKLSKSDMANWESNNDITNHLIFFAMNNLNMIKKCELISVIQLIKESLFLSLFMFDNIM